MSENHQEIPNSPKKMLAHSLVSWRTGIVRAGVEYALSFFWFDGQVDDTLRRHLTETRLHVQEHITSWENPLVSRENTEKTPDISLSDQK